MKRSETKRTILLNGKAWQCDHCKDVHWHGNFCGCTGSKEEAGVVDAPAVDINSIELDLG